MGLLVLQTAVLVLLLSVSVNLANLMIARSNGRAREFAIRSALGADRRRLIQQLLTETLVLAFAGGTPGVLLAGLAVQLFARHATVAIPRLDEVHLDATVICFSAGLTFTCVCLFGLIPAYRARAVPAKFQEAPATTQGNSCWYGSGTQHDACIPRRAPDH
jgi:ABC-type antimicrobial peptide transport system permease subunit